MPFVVCPLVIFDGRLDIIPAWRLFKTPSFKYRKDNNFQYRKDNISHHFTRSSTTAQPCGRTKNKPQTPWRASHAVIEMLDWCYHHFIMYLYVMIILRQTPAKRYSIWIQKSKVVYRGKLLWWWIESASIWQTTWPLSSVRERALLPYRIRSVLGCQQSEQSVIARRTTSTFITIRRRLQVCRCRYIYHWLSLPTCFWWYDTIETHTCVHYDGPHVMEYHAQYAISLYSTRKRTCERSNLVGKSTYR